MYRQIKKFKPLAEKLNRISILMDYFEKIIVDQTMKKLEEIKTMAEDQQRRENSGSNRDK